MTKGAERKCRFEAREADDLLFECFVRMFCSDDLLCSNVLFECFVRMFCSNVLFECFVRVFCSNILFDVFSIFLFHFCFDLSIPKHLSLGLLDFLS